MRKALIAGAALALMGLTVLVFLPLLLLGALTSAANQACGGAGNPIVPTLFSGTSVAGLSKSQMRHAAAIVAQGRQMGISDHGIVVALATASQESHFLVYANDGQGGDLGADQKGIATSLSLPHDAVGTDHGSLGVFQQQWPWWGAMKDLMNPAASAAKFYAALLKVPGWSAMPVTEAAQAVQRSAFPSAYADDETIAVQLLSKLSLGTVDTAALSEVEAQCPTLVGAVGGVVHYPLPADSGYVDQHNYGNRGQHWANRHTGDDLSISCGTPVVAITNGTVIIRTDQSWAGNWLVEVQTAPHQLTTWYAHMRKVTVRNGQQVTAGQQLGEVGDLGNATGCHLHVEVHPRGGGYGADDVDPSTWLTAHVGRVWGLAGTAPRGPGVGSFTLSSFNTLGSSHTGPHGNQHPGMASGPQRTVWAIEILNNLHVDVAGLQEFAKPQKQAFQARASGTYEIWHPGGDSENSIVWRRSRFSLVTATSIAIPYFNGSIRHVPVVLLKDNTTGGEAWFLNVHNPAETAKYHHQQWWRTEAMKREIAAVQKLTASGHAVFLTGDMNESQQAFCTFTGSGLLHAAAGGSNNGKCQPPGYHGIDWVFGSAGTSFTGHTSVRTPLVRKAIDHSVIVTHAEVITKPAATG